MLDTPQIYNQSAEDYDKAHDRWLRYEGGEAQCAFEGAVTALLRPGMQLLDAACGTGTVARRLLSAMQGNLRLTLLDASSAMLDQSRDLPAHHVNARLEDLPFTNGSFDLVTCAWGLETLPDPQVALRELVRVTRKGGHIGLVFCADRPCRSAVGIGLSRRIRRSGKGVFMDPAKVQRTLTRLDVTEIRMLQNSGPAASLIIRV